MKKILGLGILTLLIVGQSYASGRTVPEMYNKVARENKVPPTLFFAMIKQESRKVTKLEGRTFKLPWPWVINHRGTPYFFDTKHEAVKFAKQILNNGDKRFDVGLGQLNWRYHGHKFQNMDMAFEPYINLTIAARYLREQFDNPNCNNWELVVGCYHRPGQTEKDKAIAEKYRTGVIRLWQNI